MRIPIALALLLLLDPAQAQTVQKCCGTGNSTFLLGNMSYANHNQCLYLPGDLSGATDGDITRIYYRYGSSGQTSGNTLTDFKVRLVQTTETAFAGGDTFFTGLDTVLVRASYTIPPGTTGDWFAIDLDSTFSFDASLTLVVDLSFTGSVTTNFGTLSTTLAGRKLYWNDLVSPTGQSVVASWQDIGFDLATPTLVVDASAATDILLYPNPASEHLLLIGAAASAPYRLLDNAGRVLRAGDLPAEGLMVSGLASGSYVLCIASGDRWVHRRFSKE